MARLIESVNADIASGIRATRVERGWSQEALAARMRTLGMASWRQTTVAKVESRQRPRPLTYAEAVALAFALGLPTVHSLLNDEARTAAALRANAQARFLDDVHRLANTVTRLSDESSDEEFAELATELNAELRDVTTNLEEAWTNPSEQAAAFRRGLAEALESSLQRGPTGEGGKDVE